MPVLKPNRSKILFAVPLLILLLLLIVGVAWIIQIRKRNDQIAKEDEQHQETPTPNPPEPSVFPLPPTFTPAPTLPPAAPAPVPVPTPKAATPVKTVKKAPAKKVTYQPKEYVRETGEVLVTSTTEVIRDGQQTFYSSSRNEGALINGQNNSVVVAEGGGYAEARAGNTWAVAE